MSYGLIRRFASAQRNTGTLLRSLREIKCRNAELFRKCSSTSNSNYHVVVVGGGIVGAATARELSMRHPNFKIAVVEKEKELAVHQSGKNSGVIHVGVYYTPGSLKAKLCVEGLHLTYKYCDEHNIPYKKCGKLIVATTPDEEVRLNNLFERGKQNNCPGIELVDSAKISEIESNCKGRKAIWSPNTGILDWGEVNKSFGTDFQKMGGDILFNYRVNNLDIEEDSMYPVKVRSDSKEIRCKYLITCGGLYSDKLAQLSGCSALPKIIPFRGEYLLLKPEKRDMIHTNIYPVPDPRFPFLGVHFTPRINGDVWLGPNAVLATKREGYSYRDINIKELAESLAFRGLQKLAFRAIRPGIKELYRSFFLRAQIKELQKFVPTLKVTDVTRGPSGVRAQALDSDGNLVDDFVFDSGSGTFSNRVLHVRNAPSPAATSSLAIARMVVDQAEKRFNIV